MVTVVAWNIRQGGGLRRQRIIDTLARLEPDVVVLSEHRAGTGEHLCSMLTDIGLGHHIAGADPTGGYSAVIVASKHQLQLGTTTIGDAAQQARWIHTTVPEIGWDIIGCLIPAGGTPATSPIKLAFWDAILEHEPELRTRPTLITGDFNTGRHYLDEPGATLVGTDRFEAMLDRGWIDAYRNLHGDTPAPTWWSPKYHNGFRLDHAFTSPGAPQAVACHYRTTDDTGLPICGPGKGMLSDHAIMITHLPNLAT